MFKMQSLKLNLSFAGKPSEQKWLSQMQQNNWGLNDLDWCPQISLRFNQLCCIYIGHKQHDHTRFGAATL